MRACRQGPGDLPAAAARRLFDEANLLLTKAEKLGANELAVIDGRMGWLNLSAEALRD